MASLRNFIMISACCASSTEAFASPTSFVPQNTRQISTPLRSLNKYLDSIGNSPDGPASRNRSSFEPRVNNGPPPRPPTRSFEREPPSIDLNGQIQDRQSNLARRSVNEDPREFDMERRFSQRPTPRRPTPIPADDDPSMRPRQAWWDSTPTETVQGSSRRTYHAPYDRDSSHVFLETDGRPLDVEFELWDGPNNAPTRMKVYSEDGRMRPFNAMVENPMKGMRGNTLSVKNTGPLEFPLHAGVGSVADMGPRSNGLAGSESAYLTHNDLNGFHRPLSPSTARGQIVQGGALRTFPLDYSVEAVQVTIVTDGLPMNAKVELWGTSSHIKQIAEIYNDNGQTRPFAAIVDTPGGSNTIAVTNTGPMEYPIRVVVEPVSRMEGWNGEDPRFGGVTSSW